MYQFRNLESKPNIEVFSLPPKRNHMLEINVNMTNIIKPSQSTTSLVTILMSISKRGPMRLCTETIGKSLAHKSNIAHARPSFP